MAAPVISSQQLSSYAITTEGSTTASCTSTNSDQVIACVVESGVVKVAYPAPSNPNFGIPRFPNINTQFPKALTTLATIKITIGGFVKANPSINCLYD